MKASVSNVGQAEVMVGGVCCRTGLVKCLRHPPYAVLNVFRIMPVASGGKEGLKPLSHIQ